MDRFAEEAASTLARASSQQLPLLQQLQQAPRVSTGLECRQGADSAALAEQLPQLSARLPAATKLANLLHDWWQPDMQPERYAEAQLALVQAAATRSCAYLRCANLGGEGGPAAGQGAGSMRCRSALKWGGRVLVWRCGAGVEHRGRVRWMVVRGADLHR